MTGNRTDPADPIEHFVVETFTRTAWTLWAWTTVFFDAIDLARHAVQARRRPPQTAAPVESDG